MEYSLERFCVPLKLISVLRAMHKSIEVLFEVDGLKRRLSSTIGVKQGDLLGPELFTFFMAGVMETWRAGHDYEYCKLRTREDFILTGRNPNTGGKNVYGKQYTPNLQSPTANMPMIRRYLSATEQMQKNTHRYS